MLNLCASSVGEAGAYSLLEGPPDPTHEWTRHFGIGGLSVSVSAPFEVVAPGAALDARFDSFEVERPGADAIAIRHVIGVPELPVESMGGVIYRRRPYEVRRSPLGWWYRITDIGAGDADLQRALFSPDYSRGVVFHGAPQPFPEGGAHSLTLMPTDQILLSQVLLSRDGVMLHSAGVLVDGNGVLFVGPSGAGKSTMVKMLRERGRVLCDDRNIVRLGPAGPMVWGSWSHGEIPVVCGAGAPLKAMFLLKQAASNRLSKRLRARTAMAELAARVVRAVETKDWWEGALGVLERIAATVPFYEMEFDTSGQIVPVIEDAVGGHLARGG